MSPTGRRATWEFWAESYDRLDEYLGELSERRGSMAARGSQLSIATPSDREIVMAREFIASPSAAPRGRFRDASGAPWHASDVDGLLRSCGRG